MSTVCLMQDFVSATWQLGRAGLVVSDTAHAWLVFLNVSFVVAWCSAS